MNVTKFIRSFGYAFAGIRSSFSEQNFRSHCLSAIVVIIAAWWTGFTLIEWCVLLLVIGVMLALEMLNTAIERVVDLASPDVHPLAKHFYRNGYKELLNGKITSTSKTSA